MGKALTVNHQSVNHKFRLETMWLLAMLIFSHILDLEIAGIPKK